MAYDKQKVEAFKEMTKSGEIYDSVDADWIEYQHELVQRVYEFNHTPETPEGLQRREEILCQALGTYGEGLYIIPPINANCGLVNVHVGRNVVINFNCNLVDDGDIYIGDNCLIGPGVSIATSVHPVSPRLRRHVLQYNKPVRLGNNVWVGAGVTILPGVTIGDNSIVGAGSVVTKDVASDTIVVGNPARVLRKITEDDDRFEGGREIPPHILEKYK